MNGEDKVDRIIANLEDAQTSIEEARILNEQRERDALLEEASGTIEHVADELEDQLGSIDTPSSPNVTESAQEHHMPFPLADVRRIAIEVAQQVNPALEVIAATSGNSDSSYVEVIFTIRDCEEQPCVLLVGANRSGPEEAFRQTIREHLQSGLAEHGVKHADG
jgi:hypothetical protein